MLLIYSNVFYVQLNLHKTTTIDTEIVQIDAYKVKKKMWLLSTEITKSIRDAGTFFIRNNFCYNRDKQAGLGR